MPRFNLWRACEQKKQNDHSTAKILYLFQNCMRKLALPYYKTAIRPYNPMMARTLRAAPSALESHPKSPANLVGPTGYKRPTIHTL
jgi:hypothetical protein